MIVLDTHVWVWWLSTPERLPPLARRTVTEAARERSIYISSISAWEISRLATLGRLRLTMDFPDWIARSETLPFLHFVPVDNAIAVRSTRLPEPFHKDPADRMIVATAITMGAPVVSGDSKILRYPHVESVWK